MATKNLREVPIGSIIVGERFREDYGNIGDLAESIKEKGLLQPITLDENLNLLAGGRRYTACQKVGLKKIPALIRATEDTLDAREIELMENVMRKDMTWFEQNNLVAEIHKLHQEKYGDEWSGRKTAGLLGRATGGISEDLQINEAMEYLPELKECKDRKSAIKMLKKAQESVIVNELVRKQDEEIKEKGDDALLKIAQSNFEIGDALEGLEELIETHRELKMVSPIQFIEVDPPYGIELNDIKKGEETYEEYHEIDPEHYNLWLHVLCPLLYDAAGPDAWMIFWYGPTWHCEVKHALEEAGWNVDDIPAIWRKGAGQTNAPQYYLGRAYEPFFICRKGNISIRAQGRSNVFDFAPVPPSEKYHPTQRPMEMMTDILNTFTYPGSVVLIPFLGSGVTLRACYYNKMKGFGWDLSEEHKKRFMLLVEEDARRIE